MGAEMEKKWVKRYSKSHLVIGMHGSNMLLPSALSGSTLEILPPSRLGNILQDNLISEMGVLEALFRYRHIPISEPAEKVAETATSMIKDYSSFHFKMVKKSGMGLV